MASYLIEIDDKAINEQIQSILNGQTNKSLMIKYRRPDGEISAAVDVRPVVYGHWIKSPEEEEFGKTVFLSREAAEAALKEGRNDV